MRHFVCLVDDVDSRNGTVDEHWWGLRSPKYGWGKYVLNNMRESTNQG